MGIGAPDQTSERGDRGRLRQPRLVLLGAGLAADVADRGHGLLEARLPLMQGALELALVVGELRDLVFQALLVGVMHPGRRRRLRFRCRSRSGADPLLEVVRRDILKLAQLSVLADLLVEIAL